MEFCFSRKQDFWRDNSTPWIILFFLFFCYIPSIYRSFIFLSLPIFMMYLSICFYVYLSLSLFLSIYGVPMFPWVYLWCINIYMCLSLSVSVSIFTCKYLCMYLSICLLIHAFIYPCISVSTIWRKHLQIIVGQNLSIDWKSQ